MTETNPLGTIAKQVVKRKHVTQSPEDQFLNVIPAGLPLPGLTLTIRDGEDMNTSLPHDGEAVGEFLIRGPWITASYHNNAEATNAPGRMSRMGTLGELLIYTADVNSYVRVDKFHVDTDGKRWLVTGDMASIDPGTVCTHTGCGGPSPASPPALPLQICEVARCVWLTMHAYVPSCMSHCIPGPSTAASSS